MKFAFDLKINYGCNILKKMRSSTIFVMFHQSVDIFMASIAQKSWRKYLKQSNEIKQS